MGVEQEEEYEESKIAVPAFSPFLSFLFSFFCSFAFFVSCSECSYVDLAIKAAAGRALHRNICPGKNPENV